MLFTSQVIAGASGSVGGITASRNRYGQYMRVRAVPVNPNTAQQQDVRGAFLDATTRWALLTEAQRTAWSVYAQNTPVLNKLGASVVLSGNAMYVRCNAPRIQFGLSPVDAGPTTFGMPTYTAEVATLLAAGQVGSVTFDNADTWAITTGGALAVFLSRPFGPGINFFAGPYQLSTIVLGDTGTPPTSPAAVTPLPFPITIGQKVGWRIRTTDADGRLGGSTSGILTITS